MSERAANPVPAFAFSVVLMDATDSGPAAALAAGVGGGTISGSFAEVAGLNAEMETEEYREGGRNTGPHKFVKWGKYPNLVLKRGVTANAELWDWYYAVLYKTKDPVRKNGLVLLHDRGGVPASARPAVDRLPVAVWFFRDALPEKLQGPSLNAKSNELAIETLELVHQGLYRLGPSTVPGIGGALGA